MAISRSRWIQPTERKPLSSLRSVSSAFQRLMSMILAGLSWVTCLVYLDDIIIFSQTVEEHLQRLHGGALQAKGGGAEDKT